MNLLQSTWLDIICFNEAFRSVPYEGAIVFADDFKCSEDESKKFGIPSSLDSISRKLAQKMTKMMVSTEEYILLKTILLLNPGKDDLPYHIVPSCLPLSIFATNNAEANLRWPNVQALLEWEGRIGIQV